MSLFGILMTTCSFSDNCGQQSCFVLDKVDFQLSAKQWVNTETALLAVNVNVTLTNQDVVQVRKDIMDRLNKIALGDWHITQFDRSEDNSGLEKLAVTAEARIPQANLTNIYQNAKNNSKPGAAYTVAGVDFKPGLEEFQKIKADLRQRLYQMVTDELARLNKVYPSQNYSVSSLSFIEEGAPMFKARGINTVALAANPAPAPDMTVSNEITMTAIVEVASNRTGAKLANQ